MNTHWSLGRIGGLPVSLHWTVLMAFPWLFLWMHSVVAALIGTGAFVAMQLLHEFGHVLAARWRGLAVYSIELSGLHGETARAAARSEKDEVIVAWGGVVAQLLLLALAAAAGPLLMGTGSAIALLIAGPVLVVWTQWNVFLMIVALLPIGPMDGSAAWRVIPLLRGSLNSRRSPQKVVHLTPAKRRHLQAESERKAAEILDRLKRK